MNPEQLIGCVYVGAMERESESENFICRHPNKSYVEVYYSSAEHKIVEEIWERRDYTVDEFQIIYITNWMVQVEEIYTDFIKNNIRKLFIHCHNCWLNKEIQHKIFQK